MRAVLGGGLAIGIACDLRSDFEAVAGAPDDALEEYDSEATVSSIAEALRSLGHRPVVMGGGRAFLERALRHPPDLVFNIAEGRGTRSREAHVPAACEMLGIPFTHADPLASALTLDKDLAKRIVASAGVATPRATVIETVDELERLELRFPVIAKPAREGSSIGIRASSRCVDRDSLQREVVRQLGDYEQPVLVEEFCEGPEFTVGILGTGEKAHVIGVLSIVPRHVSASEFVYSVDAKRDYANQIEYVHPPREPAELVGRMAPRLALRAYRVLGGRDIGRVDIRLDAAGEPMFLELNALPGLSPQTGDIVILARATGLAYEDLIGAIVASACARCGLAT